MKGFAEIGEKLKGSFALVTEALAEFAAPDQRQAEFERFRMIGQVRCVGLLDHVYQFAACPTCGAQV